MVTKAKAAIFQPSLRAFVLFVLLLFFMEAKAEALKLEFGYIKYDSSSILTRLNISDSLPPELTGYINKGVPILLTYRLEVWRLRPGWFDKLVDHSETAFKVRYDPWEKHYAIVQTSENLTIENSLQSQREALDLLSSSGPAKQAIDDTTGVFYLMGRLTIKTMSFSNYKEVESWLKGGISDAKKPELEDAPSKVGEFVFNMALRITGLKDITREIRSDEFKITDLPLISRR
jgi:hypothetical protein